MKHGILIALLGMVMPVSAMAGGRGNYHDYHNNGHGGGSHYYGGNYGHGHSNSGFSINFGFAGGSCGSGYYTNFGYSNYGHGNGGYVNVGLSNYGGYGYGGDRYYSGYSGYGSCAAPAVVYQPTYCPPPPVVYSSCAPRVYYYSEPCYRGSYVSGGYSYRR